jgi:hypothetical protein
MVIASDFKDKRALVTGAGSGKFEANMRLIQECSKWIHMTFGLIQSRSPNTFISNLRYWPFSNKEAT